MKTHKFCSKEKKKNSGNSQRKQEDSEAVKKDTRLEGRPSYTALACVFPKCSLPWYQARDSCARKFSSEEA